MSCLDVPLLPNPWDLLQAWVVPPGHIVPDPSAMAWFLVVSGRVCGPRGALTLTLPRCTQALLSGDTEIDSASFYDRVWAAVRDKYRSEVCGKRKGSGPIPNPSQKYHLPCWSPVLHGGQPSQTWELVFSSLKVSALASTIPGARCCTLMCLPLLLRM